MIQLRKNPFSDTQIDIPFVEGENAKQLLERALSSNDYPINDNVLFHFHVVINGKIIERDFWELCKVEETDTILIAPRIARGEGGQLFKQIAIIAVAIVASVLLTPATGATFASAALVAGVTVAGTLLLNAMIPPPAPPGLGGLDNGSLESSQMYTISSQSNSARKFGTVPKVYGTHRVFPTVAANPYTMIEADNDGNIVQYFYAIYDFGFGPLNVSDVRIGETPIGSYGDANYRLVDPNKPSTNQGSWDKKLNKKFAFYKGDIERDGTTLNLDRNQEEIGSTTNAPGRLATATKNSNILTAVKHPTDPSNTNATFDLETGMVISGPGIPKDTTITAITNNTITISKDVTKNYTQKKYEFTRVGDYQVVRNCSDNVLGAEQEIILDFVCPQGLQAFGTNGKKYTRKIELKVEFSMADEDVWRSYNDLRYVEDFEEVGGDIGTKKVFPAVNTPILGEVTEFDYGDMELLDGETIDYENHNYNGTGSLDFGYFVPQVEDDYLRDSELSHTSFEDYEGDDPAYIGKKIKLVYSSVMEIGYTEGLDKIEVETTASFNVGENAGDVVYSNGERLGVIASVTTSPKGGNWKYLHFFEPLKKDFPIWNVRARKAQTREDNPAYNGFNDQYIFSEPFIWDALIIDPNPYVAFDDQTPSNKIYVKKRSLGKVVISANTNNPHYSSVRFTPKEVGQFKVRITRIKTTSSVSFQVIDKLALINIASRFDRNPIVTENRHVFMEVKVRATNQLNGAITNISALAQSVLDVYDPDTETWSKKITNNPAWIFCDLLTSSVNKKKISRSKLHLPSIVEWAEFCAEIPTAPAGRKFTLPRFTCNFVLDFSTTLHELLNRVTNAAQANLNIIDGKYGVLLDNLKTTPVQIFTPRNSMGFSSSRTYDESFHALKIKYIDPNKNWQMSEKIVYDDGYNSSNATIFDEMATFGCTSHQQAWRFGRYMIAQSRLRKERITINVDFEHLVCTRGDYVQITQDVMRVGGKPARVKEITGVNTIKIDDSINTLPMTDYGYTYRGSDGAITTSTCTVIDSDEMELDGDMPAVGDLIIIGEVGSIVYDCLVKSITPSSDLSATLELIEKADAVYEAESSDDIPDYDPQITRNQDGKNSTPGIVTDLEVVENSWRIGEGGYEYYISIDWNTPTGTAVETYEVHVNDGTGYNLVDFSKATDFEYIVDPERLDVEHSFKVLAVNSTGRKKTLLEATEVTATPVAKSEAPSDIAGFFLNITNQVLSFEWSPIPDLDLKEYLIRYTPTVAGATWEASIPLMKIDKRTTSASTQGRTGTYFIKAIDLNGNESTNAAQTVTAIPNLFDLNVIEETNDFPALEGELVTVENDTVGLTLKRLTDGVTETNEFYPEGYYYYKDLLDLGEIFTVRLQSLIEAEGFTVGDLMSNWTTLEDLSSMSLAGNSEWDVETQYRSTEELNVISEWTLLSDIETMSGGDEDNWSDWRKFTLGDATGRIFQFRLKLISTVPSVTPRVFDGVIKADMPDRLESYNNLTATPLGLDIDYTPAFKGPGTTPNIQVTQDSAESGDYYVLENKTLAGFKITFYDSSDVAVTRQFDVSVKGYGRKALAVI
jgi:hypothetical protein